MKSFIFLVASLISINLYSANLGPNLLIESVEVSCYSGNHRLSIHFNQIGCNFHSNNPDTYFDISLNGVVVSTVTQAVHCNITTIEVPNFQCDSEFEISVRTNVSNLAYVSNFFTFFSGCCDDLEPVMTNTVCCPPSINLVANGDFENGFMSFSSNYNANMNATTAGINHGEYFIGNGEDAYNINQNWIISSEQSTCDPFSGNFLIVDGATAGTTNTASEVIWEQTIPVEDWKGYKFCMTVKGLNYDHDINPIIDVIFSMPVGDITETVSSSTDDCSWMEISKNIDLWGYGNLLNIKIKLRQSGINVGNDFAIDKISLIKLEKCLPNSCLFDIVTTTPLSNTHYSVNATATVTSPCSSVWWEVCEYDGTTCISGTVLNSIWWSNSTTFTSYEGTNVAGSSTNDGMFEYGKLYRISRGTWGDCNSWNQSYKFIGHGSAKSRFEIYEEKEFVKNKRIILRKYKGE